MVAWKNPPNEQGAFTQATRCSINQGIFDENGVAQQTPHLIYVDDNLMADTPSRMRMTLAAAIQAIFVIMGFPALALRQCAVAMDKWSELIVGPIQILLGILFNTRKMTVSVTPKYRKETCNLMETTWLDREAFFVNEIETLVGKLGRIGQAYRPIYHLMPHLYASVAYAL